MPDLSELTDYTPNPEFQQGLRRVVIGEQQPNYDSVGNATGTSSDVTPASSGLVERVTNKLLGSNGEERYQLWPEKLARSGLSAVSDAYEGKIPQWEMDPNTGEFKTSPQMIERALDMSALAGTGGLAGSSEGAVLNATPSLRPALKHGNKLYKGKPGQEHADIIPDHLYNDFSKKAMSGEDLADYNFGFLNDKGHFLDRENALRYGIDNGLIDPAAAKAGALISTMKSAHSNDILDYVPAITHDGKVYSGDINTIHPELKYQNNKFLNDAVDGFIDKGGNFLDRNSFNKKFGMNDSYELRELQNPKFKFTPVDYEPVFK